MKKIVLLFFVFTIQTFSQIVKKDSVFIYYDIGEFILTAKNQYIIQSFLKQIDTTETYHVAIISSADFLGTEENNHILAGHRAEEIKKSLVGTYPNLFTAIKTVNKGEIPNKPSQNDRGNKDDRKTTIIFIQNKIINKPVISKKKTYIYNPVKREFDLAIGKKFTLKNLVFYRGTTKIQHKSQRSLKSLLRFLKENPKVEIEIQGHLCCNSGVYQPDPLKVKPLQYDDLSTERAKLVYKYLVRNGIRKKRLTYNGYGFQSPIYYPETSAEDKKLNKRVEIVITKF